MADVSEFPEMIMYSYIRCLQKDPAKRPSVAELRKDPFFKKGKDREWILKNLMGKVSLYLYCI